MVDTYRPRLADPVLGDLLAQFPAVLITGPRASGKTTTAERHAQTVIRLDQPGQAATVAADPDASIRDRPEPLLIDEWQVAPQVLGAVKRAVDADPGPGRFIVTGSVNATLDAPTWPGTGRLIHLDMFGMTVGEIHGHPLHGGSFLSRIATEGVDAFTASTGPLDLRHYVELALTGGFPQAALSPTAAARARWSVSYLRELFTRDVTYLSSQRDPQRLRRYFRALASCTACVVTDRTLHEAADVDRRTGLAYERLFADLYVLDVLPAWHSNRLKRLVRLPKRHIVDAGLAASALGLGVDGVLRDAGVLGRLLESFVLAQLRPEVALEVHPPTLHHLRDQNGTREVDVVAELADGRIIGIEVKAGNAPGTADARHLAWLRDQIGERFAGGVVLHTGPGAFPLGDRLAALPISTLWTCSGSAGRIGV